MRLLILKGLIFLGSVMALSTFENWYFAETIEGFVLQVDGQGRVLLAQNLELEEADFQRTYREWFSGDYQVVEVLDVADVTAGMHIRVSFDSRLEEESTFRLNAVDYEVLDVAFAVMEMMVPASTEVRGELTLEDIFPQKEGRLQVFSHLKERGYVQELIEVRETESWRELYFEGQGLDDESQFNLMYQINHNQVLEYIHNQDSNPLFGSETLLNSIIERKIILQAPLVVGHSWEQMFIFNGQEYTAVTEIVRVQSNDAGIMEYETLTRVEDIEGFYGNIYEERRVFVEGSGMTNFSNSQFHDPILNMEEDVIENFEFSVSLSTEYQERFVMSQDIEAENPEDEEEIETYQRELPSFEETAE